MAAAYPSELLAGSAELHVWLQGPPPTLARFVHEALGLPPEYVTTMARATFGAEPVSDALLEALSVLLVGEHPGDGDPGAHLPALAVDREHLAPGTLRPAGLWWSGSLRPWLLSAPERLPDQLPFLFFRPATAMGTHWAQAVSTHLPDLTVMLRRYVLCDCADAQLFDASLSPHHHGSGQGCSLHLPGSLSPCSGLCAEDRHLGAGQAPLRDALLAPLSALQRRHGGILRFGRSFTYRAGRRTDTAYWYHFYEPLNGVPHPELIRGRRLPKALVPEQVLI